MNEYTVSENRENRKPTAQAKPNGENKQMDLEKFTNGDDCEIPTAPASWEVPRPNRIPEDGGLTEYPWIEKLTDAQRTRMQNAHRIATLGFGIIELEAGGKEPYGYGKGVNGWKANMMYRWRDIVERFLQEPDMNYGICPGEGRVVIDLDKKIDDDDNFVDGVANWDRWVADQGEEMPETWVVESRNGGRHLMFKTLSPVGNSASGLPDGVDCRGEGGYVVGVGCYVYAAVQK